MSNERKASGKIWQMQFLVLCLTRLLGYTINKEYSVPESLIIIPHSPEHLFIIPFWIDCVHQTVKI